MSHVQYLDSVLMILVLMGAIMMMTRPDDINGSVVPHRVLMICGIRRTSQLQLLDIVMMILVLTEVIMMMTRLTISTGVWGHTVW
jgi:hypothetical protein